jgi:cytochrome b561
MKIRDTEQAYSWVSIALHWLAAILVITMLLLGERIGFQPTRPLRFAATSLHVSMGILIWIFLAAFVVWRLTQKSPKDPVQHWGLELLSNIVQWALLLAVAIQIVTGPLMILSMGRALSPFGWFQIPSPLARNHALHKLLEGVHGTTANVIIGLIVLHVLGALKHLLIDRDGVFQRMLWVRKNG